MARRNDDDEDVSSNKKSSKGGSSKTVVAGKKGKMKLKLSDADAISTGLFSSGRAKIEKSEIGPFDYNGTKTGRDMPIVWVVTYVRGKGKEQEREEAPYGIGQGWQVDKNGIVSNSLGYTQLPKSCNATLYLTKSIRVACEKQKIPLPEFSDPAELEGMDVELLRVDQEVRNIKPRGAQRPSQRSNDNGPATILTIEKIYSAPWYKDGKPLTVKADKAKDEDAEEETEEEEEDAEEVEEEEETEEADDEDEDSDDSEDEPEEEDEDAEEEGDDLTEEAVEALNAVLESGKVRVGEKLETSLEKVLGKHKQKAAIVDLATSKKFLAMKNKGWVLSANGKYVDAKSTR